jgi:mRNA interferase MazF
VAGLVARGQVYEADLEPAAGVEIRKQRPCVVVSPGALNAHLRQVVVAPLTSSHRPQPYRVPCQVAGVRGLVLFDQVRTLDQQQLLAYRGELSGRTMLAVLSELQVMFAP